MEWRLDRKTVHMIEKLLFWRLRFHGIFARENLYCRILYFSLIIVKSL